MDTFYGKLEQSLMRQSISIPLVITILCFILAGCTGSVPAETTQVTVAEETIPATTVSETTIPTLPPETTVETTEETTPPPVPVLNLTEDEQILLLQIAMAEANAGLGHGQCSECMALVMRTVLNRVESGRFSKTIRGVIYAPEQFTPVMDGSFDDAVPNELCYTALELVLYGWDESQGALYYEWCDGPSWHSQNLNLLLQHCNTRFYN